jgi:hypothetical protein
MLDHLTRAALASDHRTMLADDASGLRRGRQARARRALRHRRDRSRVDTR